MTAMRYKGYALSRNDAGMWEANAYRIRLGPYGSVEVLRAAIDQQRPDVLAPLSGQREALQELVAVGLVQKSKDPACIVVEPKEQDELIKLDALALARLRAEALRDGPVTYGNPTGASNPFERAPYTLRDHELAVWRNRPHADEDLYDAPPANLLPPRTRTGLMLLAFPLAWAALGLLAIFLTNMFAWVLAVPPAAGVVLAALSMCAGFLLLMWVRR